MTTLGSYLRSRRRGKHWSQARLAEEASALPGAPLVTLEVVRALETARNTMRLDSTEEPLRWVVRALGITSEELGQVLSASVLEVA